MRSTKLGSKLALGSALLAACSTFALEAVAQEQTAPAAETVQGPQVQQTQGPQESGERIVVTAAGFEQKITDAPASISVVTVEELKERPYMTLIDAVRDLEGVDVGETSDKTGQRTISIRGMGSDYTLVLIDGKRQNNHGDIYPNSFSGNQFNHIPPLDSIERIEVIRGPASTLYGADALGGVINIITKKVSDRWSASTSLSRSIQEDESFGDDTTFDVNLSGPIIKDVLNLSLRGSWYKRDESNPVYDPVTDPAGVEHDRALGFGGGGKTVDNTNISYGGSLTWKLSDKQSLMFDYDTSQQEYDNAIKINDSGVEEYPVGTVDNINSIWSAGNFCLGAAGANATACANNGGTWTRRANPRAGYAPQQEFTRDTWALTHNGEWSFGNSFVSLAHVATNNDGRTLPFTVAERELLLTMIDATGPYAGMSLADRRAAAEAEFLPRPKRTLESAQYTLDAKLDMPFSFAGEHVLVTGAQVIRGELTDGVFGMEDGQTTQAQEHNMYSLFAEDTWSPVSAFSLTAGVRLDDHEVFGDQLSPRLYGVYNVTPAWTVKGGVSTGFKTPKTTQLYDGVTGFGGQGTSPMFGNPDLQPETSVSSEIAAYWEGAAGHTFNLTLFHNQFEDKISSQPCGAGLALSCTSTGEYAELGYSTSSKTVNIDDAVVMGAEVAGRIEILQNLSLRANYTYTDSEQKSGANEGLPLTESAKHMANATLDWKITSKISSQLMAEARSQRYRGVNATTGEQLYYEDYEVLHLGAQYRINDFLTVGGRINNLLNQDFTSYDTIFVDNGDGTWTPSYQDHFNNKDKARSYWISLNARY
jgi:outer membrane receptor for ferrienterochelin and colicins